MSLAVHLALRCTNLPRLVSAPDEDPHFDDDWNAALPLYPLETAELGDVPGITLLVAAVGTNIFFDPTREEMAVADCVVAVSVDYNGQVVGLRTLESGTVREGGVGRKVIARIMRDCEEVGKEVFESLLAIRKAD
jgi:exosome complex component RRP42